VPVEGAADLEGAEEVPHPEHVLAVDDDVHATPSESGSVRRRLVL
jgi:hypothetical protein